MFLFDLLINILIVFLIFVIVSCFAILIVAVVTDWKDIITSWLK